MKTGAVDPFGVLCFPSPFLNHRVFMLFGYLLLTLLAFIVSFGGVSVREFNLFPNKLLFMSAMWTGNEKNSHVGVYVLCPNSAPLGRSG